MKKALKYRINQQLEKEQEKSVDYDLLDLLRGLASEDSEYWVFEPERINTFNEFFKELKSIFLKELLAGDYGADIILDAMIVFCFEVGYKLKERET